MKNDPAADIAAAARREAAAVALIRGAMPPGALVALDEALAAGAGPCVLFAVWAGADGERRDRQPILGLHLAVDGLGAFVRDAVAARLVAAGWRARMRSWEGFEWTAPQDVCARAPWRASGG